MKKIILVIAVLGSITVNAQKITVEKGKLITIVTNTDQDIDMSMMGMQMKNKSVITALVEIKDVDKDKIETAYTLQKVKMNMDMMGKENNYDSDNPEDRDSEISKAVKESIGKKIKMNVDRITGKATLEDKDDVVEENSSDPLSGMINSMGQGKEDATMETVFFVIPQGKKVGDTWVDSTNADGMKEIKNYTLKSLANNRAIIGLENKMSGTNTVENQGMQMEVSMTAITKSDITVDTKTSMVKKRTSNMDITGNVDVMGQSVPITSKAVVTVEYQ